MLDRDEFALHAVQRPGLLRGDNLDLADLRKPERIDGVPARFDLTWPPRRALEHLSLLEGYA